ncbi:suppressor of glycerol defect [Cryptotrichosporon argae]
MSLQRGRGRGRGGGFGTRGGRGGPKLPATLAAEVEAAYGSSGRTTGVRARKEMRKAKRQEKRGPPPRAASSPESRDKGKGKARPEPEPASVSKPAAPARASGSESKKRVSRPDDKVAAGGDGPLKKRRTELRLPGDDGDAEDGEIAWLEWMLEHDKGGGDLSDGLDDLLDFADVIGPGGKGLGGKDHGDEEGAAWSAEDGEDFDEEDGAFKEDDDGLSGDEDEGEDEDDNEDSEDDDCDDVPNAAASGDDGMDATRAADHIDAEPAPAVAAAGPAEPAPGKYVPPHVRAAQLAAKADADSVKAAERVKLERRAQGLLNKLSEANMESILGELEGLYVAHSRSDVTTTLTSLILDAIASKANLLDSFVVLYAGLVGALHRVVGIEFGAQVVQALVQRFHATTVGGGSTSAAGAAAAQTETAGQDRLYQPAEEGREGINLLTLIAELYNTGVISASLIYDLIRSFVAEGDDQTVLPERSVERLLRVVKSCGAQLRADDPASLKDIVALVQDATKGRERDMTTRARFMVETLVALRTGKKKDEREDVARMKRFLGSLGKKRRLLAHEPLRASLTDLLNADTRGKWWLVGAGWHGNPLVEQPLGAPKRGAAAAAAAPALDEAVEDVADKAVAELARKQGMNTDVRRAVFMILLTSEDFKHACDRLGALNLSDVAQRELVRVTLHCCGMEKTYNPYYTLVLDHLCAGSYDHRFTLQYALWDLLRELGDNARAVPRSKENVARTLGYVVARGTVDLSIFKALDFTSLNTRTRAFLTTFLRAVFIATQSASPLLKLPWAWDGAVDDEPIAEAFEKTLSNAELAGGWAYVLRGIRPGAGTDDKVVARGVEVALEIVGRAI